MCEIWPWQVASSTDVPFAPVTSFLGITLQINNFCRIVCIIHHFWYLIWSVKMRSAVFGVPPLNISKVSPSHASHETEQIKLAPVQDNVVHILSMYTNSLRIPIVYVY